MRVLLLLLLMVVVVVMVGENVYVERGVAYVRWRVYMEGRSAEGGGVHGAEEGGDVLLMTYVTVTVRVTVTVTMNAILHEEERGVTCPQGCGEADHTQPFR